MKKSLFFAAIIALLLITMQAASAAVTYAWWLPQKTDSTTIQQGQTAQFDWYAQTPAFGLEVSVQLLEGSKVLATYAQGKQSQDYAGGTVAVKPQDYSNPGTYTIHAWATDVIGAQDSHRLTLVVEGAPDTPPNADFTWTPTRPEAGEAVQFTDLSSDDGMIVSYQWRFGDGATAKSQNPKHTYDDPGTYTVTLAVTDDDGQTDTKRKTISVQAAPLDKDFTSIRVGVDDPRGDAPHTVQLSCETTGGDQPITYHWSFGDGGTSTLQNPRHTYDEPGTYKARCTATDADEYDPETISDTVTITVTTPTPQNRAPVMQPIDHQYVKEGRTFMYELEVSDPDGDPLTCYDAEFVRVGDLKSLPDWLRLDGCTITGKAPLVSNDEDYFVRVGVRDPAGLYDEEEFYLTVKDESLAPVADFSWSPKSPLYGAYVQFTDQSYDTDGSIVSHRWNFGDGGSSSMKNPRYTYDAPGTYTVTLTVKDDDGLTGSKQRTITVADKDLLGVVVDATPKRGEAPLTVQFSCSVIGGDAPIDYTWRFDDGLFSSVQNPAHTYEQPGTYTPSCRAVDATGDSLEGSVTIIVDDPAPQNRAPVMQPIADHEIPEGTFYRKNLEVSDPDGDDLVCFSASDVGQGQLLPYWLRLDRVGCVLSGTAPLVDKDEIFYIEVGVRDPAGLVDSQYYYLRVKDVEEPNQPPVAGFSWSPLSPSAGEYVYFIDESFDVDGSIVSYRWTFGDGGSSSLENPRYSYAVPGTYTVRLTVTDDDGATDTAVAQLTVREVVSENKPPVAGFSWSPLTPKVGQDVYFTSESYDVDGSIVSYRWTFGDGSSSSSQDPVHSFAVPGTYTVRLTVTDDDGATDSVSKQITVKEAIPVNQPPVAGFSWYPLVPETDEIVHFVDESFDPDGSIVSYRWTFGDSKSTWLQDPMHVYVAPGTYTVTLTVTDDDGATDSISKQVTVKEAVPENKPPVAGFSWSPLTPETDEFVYFTDESYDLDGTVVSHFWTLGDGGTSTLRNPRYSYDAPGTYTVTLVVTDDDGATDSISKQLTVEAVVPVNQPPVAGFSWSPHVPKTDELVYFVDESYDSDGTIVSYRWIFGDGGSSSMKNPRYSYDSPGTYTVMLTVTDDDGASDSVAKQLTVVRANKEFTDIHVSADPRSGQEPLEVQFTCRADGGDDPVTYAWSFGDGSTSERQNPKYTYYHDGEYVATCTATDDDGETIQGSVIITVAEEDRPLFLDEMGCNPDVVRGYEEYCSVRVVDKDGRPVEGSEVEFTYIDPANVDGMAFGECVTDFKGYCHDISIVTFEPGLYTVEASAAKEGYISSLPLADTFKVWAKRYEIVGLEVFEDDGFTTPQDTFYRGEDLYVSFTIYDLIAEEYTCDPYLVKESFLRVNNHDPLYLHEIRDKGWLSRIEQEVKSWFRRLLGHDVDCAYSFWLSSIPLSDDYLGEGKVFAFTFNFADDTAGQASKDVTVLNNPVSLSLPERFTIEKYVAGDSGSVVIDLKDFVSDIETSPQDVAYSLTGPDVRSLAENGVYEVVAGPGVTGQFTIFAAADDTDGGSAADTSLVVVSVAFTPQAPVAVAGPDQVAVTNELVVVDGSASHDPDGGGIVSYAWDFGNGVTQVSSSPTASVRYRRVGVFTVSLTVTDDEGDQDADTLTVTVANEPYIPACSDGKDNDGDGLIDMDDPGCDSPIDNDEGNIALGGEKGLKIPSVSVYSDEGFERALAGDVVQVKVVLENTAGEDMDGLRVTVKIPELGVKQKSSQFDLVDGQRVTKVISVLLPYDAYPDAYYVEVSASNDEVRRSLHRLLELVE